MENRKSIYIKLIIAIVIAFVSVYFAKVIISLNIFPDNLITILIASLVSINMISDLCLFLKGKWIKIITIVLDSIIVFVSTFGIKYGIRTDNFLNEAFNNNKYDISTYKVLVLKENSANKIEDIKHYSLGYFSKDDDYNDVLNKINEKVLTSPVGYVDIYEPYNNLISGDIDSIVLEESLLDDLKEFYTNMDDVTKVVYSFELKKNNNKASDNNTSLVPFSVYISGTESSNKKISTKSNNDINILFSINPNTKDILITYLPKESYVDIASKNGKDMLVHAGIFGLDTTVATINNLLDMKIDYSVKVNFQSLEKLVDVLGGIDINSDTEFVSEYIPSWKVIKGINHLDGKEAVAYAREKKAYIKIKNHQDNKQQVLTEVVSKITKTKTVLSSYEDILDALSDLYVTNIPRNIITDLVKLTLKDSKWNIDSQKLSGTFNSMTTYTSPNTKRNVIELSNDSINNIKNNIKKVVNK